jgi:iron complex outermembrane receptor protein
MNVRMMVSALAAWALLGVAMAADKPADDSDLLDLSVEQLLNTEVMTASRRSQAAGLVPAPLYVITQADIRRSGATSIPELLRAVPGLNVAQIDANKWAVGARGFGRRFSNKLLVLVDGRPVYSPLFSGVFWDTQDTDLDSIERIEVVSGPGATLWGPNAVNGVINVITRSAYESRARVVTARVDQEGLATVQGQVAGDLAESVAGRAFIKADEVAGNESVLGVVGDESRYVRIGGRLDGESWGGAWTVSAEAYDGRSGSHATQFSLAPFSVSANVVEDELRGGFLNTRWTQTDAAGRELSLGLFFEQSERDSFLFDEKRSTAQIEFQQALARNGSHSLLWGASFRTSSDDVATAAPVTVSKASETVEVAGIFLQDEFEWVPERWTLVAGAKVEYESLTGSSHFEPNLRIRYLASASTMYWASVARAVGMPSRGERDVVAYGPFIPPNSAYNPTPYPGVAQVVGNADIRAEQGDTFELGMRWHSETHQVRIEPTVNFAKYRNLNTAIGGAPMCMPSNTPLGPFGCGPFDYFLQFPNSLVSVGGAESRGFQIATEWWPFTRLRLITNYAYQRLEGRRGFNAATVTAAAPQHQAYARLSLDLPRAVTLDVSARYTDRNPLGPIPSFIATDARVAWAPTQSVEVALTGKNIFDAEHLEYVSEIGDLVPVPIERSVSFDLRMRF